MQEFFNIGNMIFDLSKVAAIIKADGEDFNQTGYFVKLIFQNSEPVQTKFRTKKERDQFYDDLAKAIEKNGH